MFKKTICKQKANGGLVIVHPSPSALVLIHSSLVWVKGLAGVCDTGTRASPEVYGSTSIASTPRFSSNPSADG